MEKVLKKTSLEDLVHAFGRDNVARSMSDKILSLSGDLTKVGKLLDECHEKIHRSSEDETWVHELRAEWIEEELRKLRKEFNRAVRTWEEATGKQLTEKPNFEFDKEAVKDAVDLPEIVEQYVELRKVGDRFHGLCPFHDEKTPSFVVYPDQHYHCFGCGEHGDLFSILMKIEGMSFPEAVREAAKYR